jgi:hypothetical protein
MNVGQKMMAVGALAIGLLAGCTSSDRDSSRTSSRTYDPYSTSERSYDPYDARTAGSERGPRRDEDGNLHHNPDWKSDSDRGRDSNDRDDPSRQGY